MSENDEIQDDSPNFARLRKQLAEAEAQRDSYKAKFEGARGQLVTNAAQLAGFQANEDGSIAGPGALLARAFQETLGEDDLPTPGAFLNLAQQYGLAPTGAATEKPEPLSAAAELERLQSAGDQIRGAAQIAQPPSDLVGQIAEAEAAQDWTRAGALKDQMLRRSA